MTDADEKVIAIRGRVKDWLMKQIEETTGFLESSRKAIDEIEAERIEREYRYLYYLMKSQVLTDALDRLEGEET